jgi:hypothetical protein
MGANPSLPNIKVNFKSKCCNGEDDIDGTDLERPDTSGGTLKRGKVKVRKRKNGKRDKGMVEKSVVLQSEPPDEKTISDKGI